MLTNSQRTSYFPLLSHEYSEISQSTICTMTSHNRRPSIDRASVQSILAPKVQSPAAADPPSPHIGASPNREQFSMAPPSRPNLGHARAQSYAGRRTNRLSLSFPIATGIAPYNSDSSKHTPTSSSAQSFPPTPPDSSIISPTDPTGYLVALAGQERKVLELKEELKKAEAELLKLKDQWRMRESYKKLAEIRAVQPLQAVQATGADGGNDAGDVAARQSLELDKRKALLNNLNISTKDSRRKFSGAHTRTLSLLSPERANYKQPFPFPPVRESVESSPPKGTGIPDTSHGITRINSRNRHSYQSGVTHNAKLIAEDVKAGLWTFLEDIRQATIGDEAAEAAAAKNKKPVDPVKQAVKKSSRSSLRNSDRRRNQSPRGSPSPKARESPVPERSIFDAVETSLAVDKSRARSKKTMAKQKSSKPISLAAPAIDDLDDGWSNWDSPLPKSPRWSGSTTVSEDPPTPSNGRLLEEELIK